MENQPAAASVSTRNLPAQLWPWLVILVVLLFVGFIRVRFLNVPLERDEGEYAYAGQLILQGIPPYELAYNMKWPGTYYAYALGMALFGQTMAGVHLTLLVVNSLTGIFVFLLGRKLFGVTAGLVACASYALMSLSPFVMGLAAHAEQFAVLFAVPATLLLWQAAASNGRWTYFFSGLLYGLALLMEQPAVCFGGFGVFFLLWRSVRNPSVFARDFAGPLLTFGLAMGLPFALFCLVAAGAGVFDRFWFWTVDYALSYATNYTFSQGWQNLYGQILSQLPVYCGFWALAGAGMVVAVRKPKFQQEVVFVAAFLAFAVLGTTPGLYFRQHYFILMLPAVAILAGMSVTFLQSIVSQKTRMIPLLAVAGVLCWNVYLQWGVFFQFTPLQFCRLVYKGNPFIDSLPVAQYIREHSKPDDRIAVIGSEPQIYFYSRRHSVTGYIYTYPLMQLQPYADAMQWEMIHQIERGRPEYMVLVAYGSSWLRRPTSDPLILEWADNYTRQFYEKVGIIGRRPDGQSVQIFGSDAAKFHGSLDEYLAVYKHKPDAKSAIPDKTRGFPMD